MDASLKPASELLSTKWTALIISQLATGPTRFCEFERALPGIPPRTLSKRLDELRDAGIITNCTDGPAFSDMCYRLTPKGSDLLPILRQMSKWGEKYPCSSTWNMA